MSLPVDDVLVAVPMPLDFVALLGRTPGRGSRLDRASDSCPWHSPDKNPSCVVAVKAGRVVAYCHACHSGGSAIDYAAAVWGLHPRHDFPEVVRRLADLVGVRVDDGPAPARPRRDPAIDLARTIDALADDWIAGRPLRAADLESVERAGEDAACEALADLAVVDAARQAEQERIDAELDRLADAYEAEHAGCECQGGLRPHGRSREVAA